MTRTIEERIEVVVDEIDANTLGLQRKDIREILQQHFSEPWLDKPDGPGFWWMKDSDGTYCFYLGHEYLEFWNNRSGQKWQRAIGPM